MRRARTAWNTPRSHVTGSPDLLIRPPLLQQQVATPWPRSAGRYPCGSCEALAEPARERVVVTRRVRTPEAEGPQRMIPAGAPKPCLSGEWTCVPPCRSGSARAAASSRLLTQLAVDEPKVELKRVDGDVELVGDLAEGQAAGEEPQLVPFSLSQLLDLVRVVCRPCTSFMCRSRRRRSIHSSGTHQAMRSTSSIESPHWDATVWSMRFELAG